MSRPQRVRVPWRVITSPHYGDPAVSVYVKVAALGARAQGCEAGVAYLSGLLGLSRSGIERALTQLTHPALDDDVVEMTTLRRTLRGGRGTTAVRRVRCVDYRERGVWVPSRAAEALSPRQLRAYAAVAYGVATGEQLTLGDLASVLRHRTGTRAGRPLTPRAVRAVLRDLEDLGWITVERRAGYRGRHIYTVHEQPSQQSLTGDLDEGSGGDLGEGSLATKEDHRTDSPDDTQAGGAIRRRRDQVVARGPVENRRAAATKPAYAGPQLSLAPRIWHVLEPVRTLLPRLSPYVMRRVAREIGRQLDTGTDPARLRDRLYTRRLGVDVRHGIEQIADPGRWLLAAALPRWGCGYATCESGYLWPTGRRCEICAELGSDARRHPGSARKAARPPGSGPAWNECSRCRAPHRDPLPAGLCRPCHSPPSPITATSRRAS